MRTVRSLRLAWQVLGLSFVAVACLGARARGEDPLTGPHYKFKAGQELVYTGTKRTWQEKKEPVDLAVTWHLWVLSVDKTGRSDLAIEYSEKKEDTVKDRFLFHVQVDPRGRLRWNRTLGALPAWLSPRRILPQLPTPEESEAESWQAIEPRTGLRWDYRTDEKSTAERLQITAVCKGPLEVVSVGSQQFTFEFDVEKGHLLHCDSGGFWKEDDDREEETLSLTKSATREESQLSSLRDDVDRYFSAVDEHRRLIGRHDIGKLARLDSDSEVSERFADARALLTGAQSANRNPELTEIYQQQLQRHDALMAAYIGENGVSGKLRTLADVIDQPSPDWSAEDLEGKPHKLSDYRGKIVVLDIWFRKCHACIRSQPLLDALAEEFKDNPVVFLGVNTDEDAADAEFVATQLKIPYPTLRGLDVKKLYPAAVAPTLIVIDGRGIVRAFYIGYSGWLKEELSDTINELLKAM